MLYMHAKGDKVANTARDQVAQPPHDDQEYQKRCDGRRHKLAVCVRVCIVRLLSKCRRHCKALQHSVVVHLHGATAQGLSASRSWDASSSKVHDRLELIDQRVLCLVAFCSQFFVRLSPPQVAPRGPSHSASLRSTMLHFSTCACNPFASSIEPLSCQRHRAAVAHRWPRATILGRCRDERKWLSMSNRKRQCRSHNNVTRHTQVQKHAEATHAKRLWSLVGW